jgi:hypothetical protein
MPGATTAHRKERLVAHIISRASKEPGTQTSNGRGCAPCGGTSSVPVPGGSFPAGDPRASIHADRAAAEAGGGAHVHYRAGDDTLVVVRPS